MGQREGYGTVTRDGAVPLDIETLWLNLEKEMIPLRMTSLTLRGYVRYTTSSDLHLLLR